MSTMINTEASKSILITFLVIVIVILFIFLSFSNNSKQQYNEDKELDLRSIFQNQIVKVEPPKIAYVFAGSARSFICPKVHWSIRSHLIDSLGGDPYTFVRISIEDNVNIKTGIGAAWTPQYRSNEITETLKILNPREVEYFQFSNQTEEMIRNYPGPVHTVFRENDQRRYSMFYHRCMGYKMVLKYEKQHNMRFDWVVLVRLDAAWVQPVMPIETYLNDRVWATETGFDFFNDQFMLMPRQFSDFIYDFNTKVKKGVYCLGGPDVEKWKCNATELINRGVMQDKIDLTLEYCCSDRQGPDEEGFSEIIHKRHMLYGKIPMAITRFPVMLTRLIMEDYSCQLECERLQLHTKEILANSISKAYKYMSRRSSYDTRAIAIDFHDHTKCALMRKEFFPWNPLSAVKLHELIASPSNKLPPSIMNRNHKPLTIDYSKNLYTQRDNIHPPILMNNKDLELWRIHPTWNVEGCLSYDFANHNVSWKECRDHFKHSGGNRGNPEQAFFIQVIPHVEIKSHKIMSSTDIRLENDYQLQTSQTVHNSEYSYLLHNRNVTRIMIPNRLPKVLWAIAPILCLTVVTRGNKITEDSAVRMADCIDQKPYKNYHKSQSFLTVQGLTRGSHHKTTVGRIHVTAEPGLCVARSENVERGVANWPKTDLLRLLPCYQEGSQQKILFEFEFLA